MGGDWGEVKIFVLFFGENVCAQPSHDLVGEKEEVMIGRNWRERERERERERMRRGWVR